MVSERACVRGDLRVAAAAGDGMGRQTDCGVGVRCRVFEEQSRVDRW